MPKDTQPADDAEGAGDSFDGVRIEALASSPFSESDQVEGSSPDGPVTTPGWAKRLSTRGKLARAPIIALVVIVALVTLPPHPTLTLPPGIARLLTPQPTQTPLPGKFTTGVFALVKARPSRQGTIPN